MKKGLPDSLDGEASQEENLVHFGPAQETNFRAWRTHTRSSERRFMLHRLSLLWDRDVPQTFLLQTNENDSSFEA
jgi:hypothetical protein